MLRKLLLPIIGLFALLIPLLLLSGSQVTAQSPHALERVPGQVLVKFKDNTSQAVINAEIKKQNGKVVDQINGIGTLVVNVPDKALDRVIEALSKSPSVEYVEENSLASVLDFPSTAPNDTHFASYQWGLENTGQNIGNQTGTVDADIDAQTAWNITTGNSIKVAILDTGIDQNHPDLSAKIVDSRDFTGSGSYNDYYGHGTHVGGIVAAITNNSTGVSGTCPDCSLLNGKVLNDSGSGAYSWIANGIIWATDNGAKVINMSLGGSTKSRTLENAVNYAWSRGIVIAAAAGNSSNPSKTYPGAYTNVIAVAATDNRDNKASFSSYGSWVSVAAPGVNIYSTFPTHPYTINKLLYYDYGSGTSMATPMTAGVAALIWASEYGNSNSDVRARLESTADKISGTGSYWTYGRINAGNAVAPSSTTPTPTSTPTPTESITPTPTVEPAPGGTVSVSSIAYATSGGRNSDKHLNVTVSLVNELGNPVSGASVSIRIENSSTGQSWVGTGTTGTSGAITFTIKNAPSGTYTTEVTNVSADGYTWDGVTPSNSRIK